MAREFDALVDNLGKKKKGIWTIVEDIFIVLCIFALWPIIFGWQGMIFSVIKYLALIGLIVIFVRRLRRIRNASPPDEDKGMPSGSGVR